MTTPDPAQTERLWACHPCSMIGSAVEAKAHEIARGHVCEELSEEVSEGVRQQWYEQQVGRVGHLLAAKRSGLLDPILDGGGRG